MINKLKRKNKKGSIEVMIFFIGILAIILIVGFIMSIGSSVMNWTFDEVIPELSNLGMVGDANMTEIANITIVPMNTFVQNIQWVVGVLYVLMLVGSMGIAFSFRTAPNKWLIGFYFGLVLILIILSMFVSNMYEEFYDGTGELAERLQEQTILSYMILYSPMIFSVISLITGAIMFAGRSDEEGFV